MAIYWHRKWVSQYDATSRKYHDDQNTLTGHSTRVYYSNTVVEWSLFANLMSLMI